MITLLDDRWDNKQTVVLFDAVYFVGWNEPQHGMNVEASISHRLHRVLVKWLMEIIENIEINDSMNGARMHPIGCNPTKILE